MDIQETTNASLPAYPVGLGVNAEKCGLTKREYFAAMCLQGILANKSIGKLTLWSTTQSAVMYADQLIACLEKDAGETSDLGYDSEAGSPLSIAASEG